MSAPVLVINSNVKREHGRKAQLANIAAAKAVSEIIRTTLGPRSMLKMILDPMGGIVMTNDGNAILREIDVSHPSSKSMIELSRSQDEEVGDGTTSVIILAGEMLSIATPFLARNMHPRTIVGAYIKAEEEALRVLESLCVNVDVSNKEQLMDVVRAALGTKFVSRFGDLIASMAVDAVTRIAVEKDKFSLDADRERLLREEEGEAAPSASTKERRERKAGESKYEVDIKRYARVEKIPGGLIEDCRVLNGLMINKDVVEATMRRKIVNPRIVLMDSSLEYKKGENQTSVQLSREEDFEALLKAEEDFIDALCKNIIRVKPDLVFTEKGCSDLAAHFLAKAGISVIRRVRSTDNDRIARATGATIVNEAALLTEKDVGTECGLFEVVKIGDEYHTYLVECKQPKAVTIVLRGASKDVLNEMERNLIDAMHVVRNIVFDPRIVPGGGASEMAIAQAIRSKVIEGPQTFPFRAVAEALEIIPKTLIENCGGQQIRLLTELRAKHAADSACTWGIDGNKGEIADMKNIKVWEPLLVKNQTIKTAIEAACMILRIDDIHSGMSKEKGGAGAAQSGPEEETFGDNRDG